MKAVAILAFLPFAAQAATYAECKTLASIDARFACYRTVPEPEPTASRCSRLGGISIGMTPAEVRKSCWGAPRRVNVTGTASHRYEQWVYRGQYLYFTDGVVTAYQQ
jgi:hypothetical protein